MAQEHPCCNCPPINRLRLRAETPEDHQAVEHLTREAFWNVYRPGCVEHYLLHHMRLSPAYMQDMHTLALEGNQPVGSIVYSRAWVKHQDGAAAEVLTLGPLSVLPAWQRKGVGSLLMGYTLALARHRGERGVLLMGDPAYYSRFGFRPAADFGLTLPDGTAPGVFQALELYPHAFDGVRGAWQLPPVFDDPDPEALAAYDAAFPPKEKRKLPGQLFSS